MGWFFICWFLSVHSTRFLVPLFFLGRLVDTIVRKERGVVLLVSDIVNIIINIIYNFNTTPKYLSLYRRTSLTASESSEITQFEIIIATK
jgi:hypothetical protein